MAEEEDKVASSAERAGGDASGKTQPYQTAAEIHGIAQEGTPNPALSQSPGLVAIEGSTVPGGTGGAVINHVQGPGQAPVDPVAAGLDTEFNPLTRHQMRAPTLTGTDGAGQRPSTYADKPGGLEVKQSTDATHETVPPPETP